MRTLVAQNGFHGAFMSAVAREAGVATGTAYSHYASKDELVLAAYGETKAALGRAVTAGLDPLPLDVIWELSLSPAGRLAAGGTELTQAQLDEIAGACWRSVTRPR